MADITIRCKNHVHAIVDTEVGIMQEISDYFTFEQPGARFMPQFRAKVWDGKVRLYSMFTKELYKGLVPYVKVFAETMGYTVEDLTIKHVDKVNVEQFVERLNLHGHGKPITIRDYQIDAINHAIDFNRTLLLSPTGSGKSLIIYSLMRYHLSQNRRQLIIVPTTSLVEQLFTDFQDYSSANGWKTTEHVHRIYAGHEKSNQYPVVISTWQSLHKLLSLIHI